MKKEEKIRNKMKVLVHICRNNYKRAENQKYLIELILNTHHTSRSIIHKFAHLTTELNLLGMLLLVKW